MVLIHSPADGNESRLQSGGVAELNKLRLMYADVKQLARCLTTHSVVMPIPNSWWSQYPSVSMIYTSEAGRYLTVHGMTTDPKWTGETTLHLVHASG